MSFRDMVARDNLQVFSNVAEFATEHTIVYDGETYEGVPCVISQLKAKDRPQTSADHAQGLYSVTSVVHFAREMLGGFIPEKGSRIGITDEAGFLRDFYVAQSGCDLGMVRLELEAYDE